MAAAAEALQRGPFGNQGLCVGAWLGQRPAEDVGLPCHCHAPPVGAVCSLALPQKACQAVADEIYTVREGQVRLQQL